MPWEAQRTQTKKRFSTALCKKTVPSVTFGYFQPHFCTGISTVSTVSYLTTKDNSDRSQGPLNLKIALLTTVNARRFFCCCCQQSLLSYLCPKGLVFDRSPRAPPPPLSAASLRCVIRKVRVLSAARCPTLSTGPLEPELPTTRPYLSLC